MIISADMTPVTKLLEGIRANTEKIGLIATDLLRQDARRQFASGGDPSWLPLSPYTVEQKRRDGYVRLNRKGIEPEASFQNGHFGPENILMRTMALWASWCRADDPNHYEEWSETGAYIGSDLEYAATHQYGRPGGGWHNSDIPARPILVSQRTAMEVAKTLELAAAGPLRG